MLHPDLFHLFRYFQTHKTYCHIYQFEELVCSQSSPLLFALHFLFHPGLMAYDDKMMMSFHSNQGLTIFLLVIYKLLSNMMKQLIPTVSTEVFCFALLTWKQQFMHQWKCVPLGVFRSIHATGVPEVLSMY